MDFWSPRSCLQLPPGAKSRNEHPAPRGDDDLRHDPRVAPRPEVTPAGPRRCEYRGGEEPRDRRVPFGSPFHFGPLLVPFWTLWSCPRSPEGGVSVASTILELACSPPRLHPTGHGLYESPPDVFYGFSARLVWFLVGFFFGFCLLFPFSLFVFFVCFVFLHVQFCKANSRYCISQLVSLQRKFTVSCSLLRYSLNGFLI